MLFYLHCNSVNKDFRNKGKLIVFDSEQEASAFNEAFYQWAMAEAMGSGDFGLIPIVMNGMSNMSLLELENEKFDSSLMVNFYDLRR